MLVGYILKERDEQLIEKIKTRYHLDSFFAELLVAKNFTENDVYKLIHLEKALIDANTLVNAKTAAIQIAEFIKNPLHVLYIFADYDADGLTAGYILYKALKEVARCEIQVHYPERSDGYGISLDWCKKISAAHSSDAMVVTVDNGTSAVEAITYLQNHGIQTIVTDHHTPSQLAPGLIVNPKCYQDDPNKHLAGCGVAFKVALLVQEMYGINRMHELMDILAIGTIGDMMPMHLENIAYCYYGLMLINNKNGHAGIRSLMAIEEIDTLTYKDIAFKIVPKLNSCGRMGNINLAKTFLFSPSNRAANAIVAINEERKTVSADMSTKGYDLSEHSSVIHLKDCKEGIAGIVANNLMQERERDMIVLTGEDQLKGSARSITNTILEKLEELSNDFETLTFGGHNGAAGISIHEEELEDFKNAFDQLAFNENKEEKQIMIDMSIDLHTISKHMLQIIQSLPYDQHHLTEPIFCVSAALVKAEPTKSNPKNAWVFLTNGKKSMKIWAENFTSRIHLLPKNKNLKWIVHIDNNFMTPGHPTLKIVDVEVA